MNEISYNVWFCDLEKVIEAFREKVNASTFSSISGNAYGDFVIKHGDDTWIVKHRDFSVWHLVGDWRDGKWVEC